MSDVRTTVSKCVAANVSVPNASHWQIGEALTMIADAFALGWPKRYRPAHAYLHTGFGQHECPGQHIDFAVVPEVIRHILILPGIHLLDGAGGIDLGGGPFPEHFVLGLRPEAGLG